MTRRRLATALLCTAGLGLLGGCVSQEQYDQLMAANMRCNEQVQNLAASNEHLRRENKTLKDRLSAAGSTLGSRQEEFGVLERQNEQLRSSLEQLRERYEKLIGRDAPPPVAPLAVLPEKVNLALKNFAEKNPGLVEYLEEHGMLKFKSDLTFKPGSDFVQPGAKDVLQQFARIVQGPQAKKFNVYIAGHTDNMPIAKRSTKRRHPNNWYLSVHRAVAVQDVLTDAGVAPERLGAMGFGKHHPVVPNKTGANGKKLGAEANRRVEIWVVPPDRFLTGARGEAAGETPADADKG